MPRDPKDRLPADRLIVALDVDSLDRATGLVDALAGQVTRFKIGWNWDGSAAVLMSRAVDSTGYVQPSVQDVQKVRAIVGFVQHNNAIQPWSVNAKGEVRNVIGQA